MSRSNTRVTVVSEWSESKADGISFSGRSSRPILDAKASLTSTTSFASGEREEKEDMSWDPILEGTVNREDIQQAEPVLFSKYIKKSKTEGFVHPAAQVSAKFLEPYFKKEEPLAELSKKPGYVPISNFVHFESHRARRDSNDDGLDVEDIKAIAALDRRTEPLDRNRRESRCLSFIKEAKSRFLTGKVSQVDTVERLRREAELMGEDDEQLNDVQEPDWNEARESETLLLKDAKESAEYLGESKMPMLNEVPESELSILMKGDVQESVMSMTDVWQYDKSMLKDFRESEIALMNEESKVSVPSEGRESEVAGESEMSMLNEIQESDILLLLAARESEMSMMNLVQESEMSILVGEIDHFTLKVADLLDYIELNQAPEVAAKVGKLAEALEQLDEQDAHLKEPQGISAAEKNEDLVRLRRDLEAFEYLWLTANEWLRIREFSLKLRLSKINEQEIAMIVSEGMKAIDRSMEYFNGFEPALRIAREVRQEILTLEPVLPVLRALKNPDLRERHWEAISDAVGFPVDPKGTQSFQELLDGGIATHVDTIIAIVEIASKEVVIEKELDKMDKEMQKYRVVFGEEPDSKVRYMVLGDDVLERLDACIIKISDLMQDEFRKPFEASLEGWETRLNLSRKNISELLRNQKQWLEMQPAFDVPVPATATSDPKLAKENDMRLKLYRVWGRILCFGRLDLHILDLGRDHELPHSLAQFAVLLMKMQKMLDARVRSQNSDSDEDIQATTDN